MAVSIYNQEKKTQTAGTAGEGLTSPEVIGKRYYSAPTLGADTAAKKKQIHISNMAIRLREAQAKKTAQDLQSAQRMQLIRKKQADYAKLAYRRNPTEDGLSAVKERMIKWVEATRRTKEIGAKAENVRSEYETAVQNYNAAVNSFNSYIQDQHRQYSDWRSTIREAGDIQAELEAVEQQLAVVELNNPKNGMQNIVNAMQNALMGSSSFGTQRGVYDAEQAQALAAKKALLEEELEYSRYFQYEGLKDAADFADLSQYASTANGRESFDRFSGQWTNTGFNDILYDYINKNQDAITRMDLSTLQNWGGLANLKSNSHLKQMTDDEVAVYNYLYATQGREKAGEYLKYLESGLNAKMREQTAAIYAEEAKEHPFWASVASVMTSPAKVLGTIGTAADYLEDGKIDQNKAYNYASHMGSSIRNQVSDDIENGKGGKAGSYAYQLAMSMGDSLMNRIIGGFDPALSRVLMASGAAADSYIDAKDRGLSDDESMALGTMAGVWEAAFESMNIEEAFDPKLLKDGVVKYIAKNAGSEAAEELGTNIANFTTDIVVGGDKSQFVQSVAAYEQEGMSRGKAIAKALGDQAISMGLDALGGFLSGGVISSVNTAGYSVRTKQLANQLKKMNIQDSENVAALIESGFESGEDTESYQLAKQLQKKVAEGKTPTATELARLTQANEQAMGQEQAERTRTESEIEGQVQRLSEALGRKIRLFDEEETENGITNGFYEDEEIWVNRKSGDPMPQIISHELTHSVENAEVYSELSRMVLDKISQDGGDLAAMREQIQTLYAKNGVRLNNEIDIDKEIVAEYVAKHLLTDEVEIRAVVQQKPTLGRKILDWLDGILAKLGVKASQERQFVTRAKDLYSRALEQTRSGTQKTAGDDVPAAEVSEEYDSAHGELQSMRAYAQEAYESGQMTDEEYDSFLEMIEQQEEMLTAKEPKQVDTETPLQKAIRKQFEKKYSISPVANKRDVAKDLRQILARGGDAAELRKYVQSVGQIETNQESGTGEAQKILKAARRQGLSVSEYLQQNWELFDVDGQWNESARQALEMEKEPHRRYSITATSITAEEAKTGIETVAKMDPVARITGDEFAKGEKDLVTQVAEFFAELGNRVYNPQLGSVVLDRQGVKSDIAHGIGRKKAATFAAVPDVVARGYVVDYQKNWKGRGYDTAVVAAPVQIGEEEYLMGVVLNRNPPENKFYVHEVMTTENGASPFKTGARKGDPSGNTPSVFSILDKIRTVKNQGDKNGASQVSDETTPDRNARNELASTPTDRVAQDGSDVKKQFSISDSRYMDAVNRGDLETAQKMVDQAAKEAGYTIKAYHGTDADVFTVFDKGKIGNASGVSILGDGFYFADTKSVAAQYGKNVFEVYLKQSNPYYAKQRDTYRLKAVDLEKNGNDGVKLPTGKGNIFMVLDPEQIKSAEPVTYDNDGNAIPLSMRFDTWKNDIRYSISDNEEDVSEDTTQEDTTEPSAEDDALTREKLPAKARDYLAKAERLMLKELGDKLCVSYMADRSTLMDTVKAISDEYLHTGQVSQESYDELFEQAYERAMMIDREFYDQYKDVKEHLRTTPVTLSERDRADIADFGQFKRDARNILRIVNEDGMPVDSYYRELQEMAKELFPDYITHPADQLQHMKKVALSIAVAEKTLREFYGPGAEDHKRWAKNDFQATVAKNLEKLRNVVRYADEQEAKRAEQNAALESTEEVMAAYEELKKARRAYEKVMAKHLITEADERIIGELLRGERTMESIDPEKYDVDGIQAVYEAKAELNKWAKQIAKYKSSLRAQAREEADALLQTANEWKDKKAGILYSRETMRRNVFDIVKDKSLAEQITAKYFDPVARAEAKAVRMKNAYRERVKELGLSTKVKQGDAVSEAHAVQLLGEAEDNIRMIEKARGWRKHRDGKTLTEWRDIIDNLWKENPGLDEKKIRAGVEAFRQIYDELFVKMNEVRVANGYEPVNYRSGYFPHFQPGESDGVLAHFGKAMGISTDVVALPTTINGLTHTFKPGIQWFGNAQERLGFNTAYDAIEGFDKYIEGVASVIYQTENIQKLRALATQIRYRTSDEGLRKQVDAVYAKETLTEEEKQAQIADIFSKGKYSLSNFVVELDEYTNLLANKKSKLDRTVEGMIGRKFYVLMKWMESRVGANMIAGNLSSALTNIIPLTQAGAQLDSSAMLQGMWATLKSMKESDGLDGRSDFITNRRGSDPLVQTWAQKASSVAGKPMELIDSFVSESIVRAAYISNMKQGLTEEEAMRQADLFAAGVMADRSKGAQPTLFASSNPLIKLFTQFQLEVNNQFSELFKDLPRRFRDKGLLALSYVLLKYFLGAWLFNELYEKLFGRRPAMDPIGILVDTVGDINDGMPFGEVLAGLAGNVVSELPFSSALSVAGLDIDGGRIPISSAMVDIPTLWNALTNDEWDSKKRWKEGLEEASKPLTYLALPFGGNQLSKIWKGVAAYIKGGSYSVDSEGNDILQYPVYKDDPADAWSILRATLMGKSSLPEAQDWVDSEFDSLSAKQTAAYEDMKEAGVQDRAAYGLLMQLQGAKESKEQTKTQVQMQILRESDISDEGKAIAYYGLVGSESDRELMDKLGEVGASANEALSATMKLRDSDELKGIEKKQFLRDAIRNSGMTDEEKGVVIERILGSELLNENGNPTQFAKYLAAIEGGLDVDDWLEIYGSGTNIDTYLKGTDAGLSSKAAMDLAMGLETLEPEEGEEDVSNLQKWRLSVDFTDDVDYQLAALSLVMSDNQILNADIANDLGVSPDTFVRFYEVRSGFDVNGNGSYSQAEVQAAIDSMKGLTLTQKAVLWQLANSATKSAKKNPYSQKIGQKVLDARAKAKENEE